MSKYLTKLTKQTKLTYVYNINWNWLNSEIIMHDI